jgi:hypothetical protein
MGTERERILKMVAEGKLSINEADELLDALSKRGGEPMPADTSKTEGQGNRKEIKYLFVKVTSSSNDNVDVRIPMGLLRAGMKFTSLIPPQAREQINNAMKDKGISFDLNNMKKEDIEELIQYLGDMEVNVISKNGDNVRVYCA